MRCLGLWIVMVAWLVAPAVAVAQSPDRIVEGHYQKGLASYKSKPPDYASAVVWYRKAVSVRLPSGNAINVDIPIKIFTDPELRDLGILKPDGSIAIKEKPNLPYKPMRAASEAQKRRFFEEYPKTTIAIHWPPYVVTAPGLDKQPPGTKEIIRESIERLYER